MSSQPFQERIRGLPAEARKLLCVIVQQAFHGSLRSKEPGIATLPEVHEACGLDVDGMYAVLEVLRDCGVIEILGEYPFEEVHLVGPEAEAIFHYCESRRIALERVLVDLQFELLDY